MYQKYNTLIDENEYGVKYDISHTHMFVIEGMNKVRDIIEKNRKRKLTKHKKLSNNAIIEIDNCSPLEILKLQKNLTQIAVENYFIVHTYVSNDRTDYNTLIPVLEKHKDAFEEILEDVTADSGYCSGKISCI